MRTHQFNVINQCLVVLVLLVCMSPITTARAFSPQHLRVSEGFDNPLGFYDATPSFSWQLPVDAGCQRQTAYRLVVASDTGLLPGQADLWDSGKVTSDQSVWLPYQGKPLGSRQRVYWQVQFWDERERASAWSETASFELGLLKNSDWQGHWIRLVDGHLDPDTGQPSPTYIPGYLRREFPLSAAVTSARLHVTARGLFEVHLNGKRVGLDFMVPGWTPYYKRIETLTYDVTDMLQTGKNAIGAVLGEGWYAGRLMREKPSYPEVMPVLLLQLEITLSNGKTQTIVTAADWKATNRGPIRFSGIYDGETYDARLEMPGWNKVGFDDTDWAKVHTETVTDQVPLVPKRHYPVRVTQELPTLAITEPHPGVFIFDLGQNMVGWPQLNIPVYKNRRITVRMAEMLQQDGTLYTKNYRSAKSTDTYTAAQDGFVTWQPTFTFHGFRYIELTGFPLDAQPRKGWVTGQVLHSDFPQSGQFSSSHAKLNQLQSNINWGQRGNYLDIPTDCPQRNERLGWTGDAQVFCATSFFNYDVYSFWASWLQSVREDQLDNGYVPHVVPNILTSSGSPGWGDVAINSPWDIYVRTGDRQVLIDNYDMMQRWTAAYARDANDFIVNREGYGDWLQPYTKTLTMRRGRLDDRPGDTPKPLLATAYYGRCAVIMQKVAGLLGKTEEAELYRRQHERIRSAFSRAFFDGQGKLTTDVPTQTAYLLALGYDLLEPDLRKEALANLLALIEEADGHLRTGFLGTPLLPFVLDDLGHADVAFSVLFKETYPSWFFSINQGATTMWERWNSYSHKDGFGDARMNSFNHYAYGAVGQWMVERIAGLAPDPEQPGYKHFYIRPQPGGPLRSAEAKLQTPYGLARSAWQQEDDRFLIQATVPPNTTATIVLPASVGDRPMVSDRGQPCQLTRDGKRSVYRVMSGSYSLTVQ